jgi:hypothetical protein
MDQAKPSVRLLVFGYPCTVLGARFSSYGIVGSDSRTVLSLGQPLYPVSVSHNNLHIQSFP